MAINKKRIIGIWGEPIYQLEKNSEEKDFEGELSNYFDRNIIDYVAFTNGIIKVNGTYGKQIGREIDKFSLNTIGAFSITNKANDTNEVRVSYINDSEPGKETYGYYYLIRQEEKILITKISQEYNDSRFKQYKSTGRMIIPVPSSDNFIFLETPELSETLEPILYKNKNLGFSLQFPGSWRENYIIEEGKNDITVLFVSKSKVELNGFSRGIPLFKIGSKDELDKQMKDIPTELDSIEGPKLGKVTDIEFFEIRVDLGGPLLSVFYDFSTTVENDKNTRRQAYLDYIIARKMLKDKESIFATFKESK